MAHHQDQGAAEAGPVHYKRGAMAAAAMVKLKN